MIENHPILPPSLSPVAKITSVCLLQVDQGAAETGVEGAAGLANCPAAFLSYFHCGFVMKYSRRWEPSIRLSKMFEPFLWLEMTNLRAVFG